MLPSTENESVSTVTLLHEVAERAERVIRDDVSLFAAETQENITAFSRKLGQAVLCFGLFCIGAIPLLAALVLGLGRLWDGHYALSALTVGLVATVGCGILTLRAVKALDEWKFDFKQTRSALKAEADLVAAKFRELKNFSGEARP